ncbi:MAG: MBL fold metallo-hydrolase [Candidatus Aenigmarchaeota archaeon]|nr:MBL fold metallo-hydrolase [Candidatus Aenigmarchaeota archaeon]
MKFTPIWFDSLGAKSSCVLIATEDVKILIDPGIAIMQPSFPAPLAKKLYLESLGLRKIKNAMKKADVIVISHYHYDHYLLNHIELYKGKTMFVKNPNEYINDSQRKRAKEFFQSLYGEMLDREFEEFLSRKRKLAYPDPLRELKLAMKRDFGDYAGRRKEVLKAGYEWFRRRTERWNKWFEIKGCDEKKLMVEYAEGRCFEFGKTRIRFTKPLFHGVEFSRVGWVFSTVVERKGEKIIHTSDVNGPIIEDYAEWIAMENPDILVLDGPMTYMFGYLLNRTNLQRAVKNLVRILKTTDTKLIIYDHHLPREAKFREHTKEVWEVAKRLKKRLITAAEFLGKTPEVLKYA